MTAGGWGPGSRERFNAGVMQVLEDDGADMARMVPGSLRVSVGGSAVTSGAPVATWCQADPDRHRLMVRTLLPADLARVLHQAAEKLEAAS